MQHNHPQCQEQKGTEDKQIIHNLDLANGAWKYSRKYIPFENSFTQPAIKDRAKILELYKRVSDVRHYSFTLEESLYFLLLSSNNPLIKITKHVTKKDPVGNCGELSTISTGFLRKNNVRRIEIASIENGDHAIVIMNRDMGSDINDVTTFGKHCVILDTLNNDAYPSYQIFKKLNRYNFDLSKDDPHTLSPFTKQDRLKIIASMDCYADFNNNQQLLSQFYNKMDMMVTLAQYHGAGNHLIKELNGLITQYKLALSTEDLSALTNFEVERKLDKKTKDFVRKLTEDKNVLDKDALYINIILSLANCYSPFHYFSKLLRFEDIFALIMASIQIHEGPAIDYLTEQLMDADLLNGLLWNAVFAKKPIAAEILLQWGADPTIKIDDDTVLIWAIKNNHTAIIQTLIDKKGLLFQTDANGLSPIHIAAGCSHLDGLKLILEACPRSIDHQDPTWQATALHFAANYGITRAIEVLLKKGANIEIRDLAGYLPIHRAVEKGHIDAVKLMLDHSPKLIGSVVPNGQSLLLLASHHGHGRLVEELLARKNRVKIKYSNGQAPLFIWATPTHTTNQNHMMSTSKEKRHHQNQHAPSTEPIKRKRTII